MGSIVLKSKQYCLDLLMKSRCKKLPFHGIQHTLEVFDNVQLIGKCESIPELDLEPVLIAALFHDTGMSKVYAGHEQASCEKAIMFLESQAYPKDKIDIVVGCILATQMPQNPTNELEAILCDADLFHLSGVHFMDKNILLREEWEHHLDLKFTDKQWYLLNLEFLQIHQYHTPFGQEILQPKQLENLSLFINQYRISC